MFQRGRGLCKTFQSSSQFTINLGMCHDLCMPSYSQKVSGESPSLISAIWDYTLNTILQITRLIYHTDSGVTKQCNYKKEKNLISLILTLLPDPFFVLPFFTLPISENGDFEFLGTIKMQGRMWSCSSALAWCVEYISTARGVPPAQQRGNAQAGAPGAPPKTWGCSCAADER